MAVIEIYPEPFGWCVRPQGGFPIARLPTLEAAEGRARWLATCVPIIGPEPQIVVETRDCGGPRDDGDRWSLLRPRNATF